ncbi:MAG: hypothetical protein HQ541_00810, partial [Mariniphaga sp.]|nr:hypothetical protein [Mariniphaga sp.]
MIGSHTIISKDKFKISGNDYNFLKHEKWFQVSNEYQDNHILLIRSYYEGYPFENWDKDDYFILLEGMIYNFTEEKIENSLKEIGYLFCNNGDYYNKITEFVENADGDFVIQIYDKQNKKYILFNDYL